MSQLSFPRSTNTHRSKLMAVRAESQVVSHELKCVISLFIWPLPCGFCGYLCFWLCNQALQVSQTVAAVGDWCFQVKARPRTAVARSRHLYNPPQKAGMSQPATANECKIINRQQPIDHLGPEALPVSVYKSFYFTYKSFISLKNVCLTFIQSQIFC